MLFLFQLGQKSPLAQYGNLVPLSLFFEVSISVQSGKFTFQRGRDFHFIWDIKADVPGRRASQPSKAISWCHEQSTLSQDALSQHGTVGCQNWHTIASAYSATVVPRTIHPFPRCPKPARDSRLSKLVVYYPCVFRRRRRTRRNSKIFLENIFKLELPNAELVFKKLQNPKQKSQKSFQIKFRLVILATFKQLNNILNAFVLFAFSACGGLRTNTSVQF